MRIRFALVAVALTTLTSRAPASELRFGANDLQTLFFISKSDDRNRVDYGMRLDSRCAPYGEEPVFPSFDFRQDIRSDLRFVHRHQR